MTNVGDIAPFGCWSAGESDLIGRYAVAYAGAIVRRIAATGRAAFLDDSIDRALACLDAADVECWNASFGTANAFANLGDGASEPAAGQLFLALSQFGFEGRYEAAYRLPTRHRWRSCWLPAGKSIQMIAEGGSVTVIVDDIVTNLEGKAAAMGSQSVAGLFGRGVTTWGYALDPVILEPGDLPLDTEIVPVALNGLREAARMLAIDERITKWCSRLLQELSLTYSDNHQSLTSRSNPLLPGTVQISVPGSELHLAELLVHEAAHQHYFLAAMAGSYITPDNRYITAYSALRGCERPIERVFLGLHALVNIADFLAVYAESDKPSAGEAIARIVELAPTIRSMKSPFALDSRLLSDRGHALLGDGLARLDAILERYADSASVEAEGLAR